MTCAPEINGQAEPVNDAEPDYRFTLANERTFLAWIRTALGLLAAGVAVDQLTAHRGGGNGGWTAAAAAFVGLSVVLAAGAYRQWRLVQAAMRTGDALPAPPLLPVLGVGVGVIGLLAITTLLIA
ncbi:DUF202 domain-containing protein [Nocardia sp. NPDC050789]|uniref:YidH family protein n=1 Tax=Nocardia sp. NPDC050789 TaxID=3154841 RepID=UPI0033DFE74F